ncbi:MAG: ubiquinone anaerobic biosynthesis accessory factor UbiT [Gemmatimonadota bacterium]
MNASLPLPSLPAPPDAVRRLIERLPIEPPSFVLAKVLNRVLLPRLGADARAALADRCVEVHVSDFGVKMRLALGARGFALAPRGADVALRVSATASAFWRMASGEEDADTLFFERALVMEGDTEFGLLVKNTLDAIGPLVPAFLRQSRGR